MNETLSGKAGAVHLAHHDAALGKHFFDLSQSALSQHLAELRVAGMVATRRDCQTIYYRISDPDIEVQMAALYEAFCKDM